jgi:hypothetical protein
MYIKEEPQEGWFEFLATRVILIIKVSLPHREDEEDKTFS